MAQAPQTQAPAPTTPLTEAYRHGGVASALFVYEQTTTRTGKSDPAGLRQLAQWTVTELSASSDDQVRNAACAATVAYSRDKACIAALQSVMGDANNTFAVRLLAVNALRAAHDPFADKALTTIATQAAAERPVDAAAMLRQVEPAVAVPLLRGMLATNDPQQQYAAASVLASIGDKSAAAALAEHVHRVSGAAKIAALSGLAASGDAASKATILDALPLLRGSDLLVAGRALQRSGDPRGTRALAGLLASDDQMVALDAASSLAATPEKERAKAAIHAALASPIAGIRARAVKMWREGGWPSDQTVRKLLADTDPWVRIEAAATIMREAQAPAAPARR